MSENLGMKVVPADKAAAVEHVYREWDRARSNDDLEAMVAFYAPDAILESALVAHLLGTNTVVLQGQDQIQYCSRKPRQESRESARSIASDISQMAHC
jgi:ketosteroid isomerase-like protein